MIKAKYNQNTNLVNGYYPSFVDYKNNIIDTEAKSIDGEPYLEITQEDWEENRGKEMVVIDGVYQEYVKSDQELLEETRGVAISNRKIYLRSSFEEAILYYEPDNMPQEIKDKRILARAEMKQIEQETNINKIIIDFE